MTAARRLLSDCESVTAQQDPQAVISPCSTVLLHIPWFSDLPVHMRPMPARPPSFRQ